MAPKLFVTGVTGYIGGDFLYAVTQAHPDWDITALVRNSDKGASVAAKFPSIKLVHGDNNSSDVIEAEASKADIVYHFANSADDVPSAQAIATGLAKKANGGFWIHTSGTGILTFETFRQKNGVGENVGEKYNDWDGIGELTSLPDDAAHRNVDKIVLAAGSDKVKTAIVCPPTIYGPGRGPDNQRSMQAYKAAEGMLKAKKGFYFGSGSNVWHQVHVHDLSDLFVLLGEAAVNGGAPATWNDQGYYLAENGAFLWGDILKAIAKDAHQKGFLEDAESQSLTEAEASKFFDYSHYFVGTTSKGDSIRAKKLLGWKPHRPSLLEEIPIVVDSEARDLGLTKTHAEQAAGQ